MKKILSLTLCLLLFTLTALPLVSVSALEEPAVYRNKDYIFEVTDTNEISILYYIGTENTVTVPAEICGLPVKSIEKWAFFGTDVQKVTVSEGVTVIKEEAFYNCQSLENVTLPSTLESTGTAIFRFCQNLKNVTFAGTDSSPELGEYLFYACNTLESVNIPSEVTSIPKGMFAYCQSLNNLTLPEKTEEISDYAFYNSGLETITLPRTLNSIGERAFADCTTLDEINNLNETCDTLSPSAFEGTPAGNPYENTGTTTIFFLSSEVWENAYVYGIYGASPDVQTDAPLGEYPGINMTHSATNPYGQKLYTAEIPSDIDYIKFSDGSIDNRRTDYIANSTFTEQNGIGIRNMGEVFWEAEEFIYAESDPFFGFPVEERKAIYFANTIGWTDIRFSYYLNEPTENGNIWSSETDMSFYETNAFGQDIYIVYTPDTTTVRFYGTNSNGQTEESGCAEIIDDNNAFYIAGNDPLYLGTYKYSPDKNPLDPDATVPESTKDETITQSKTTIQPVGASSTEELSESTTKNDYLVGEAYPEVVKREKGRLTTIGAQVEEDRAALSHAPNARLWGDANHDDEVNIRDTTEIQKHAAELIHLDYNEYKNADIDCNGNLNIKDATAIQKFLVQLNPDFPKGPFQSA